MSGPIEAKAAAGPTATLIAGYLSAVLIEAVPWLRDHLTADQKQNLPIVIAFLCSVAAAYVAPHTHRPDLPPLPALPQANIPTAIMPPVGPDHTTAAGRAGRHEQMGPEQ
jgi:hypothetical protein